ncbi:hypothetical protein ABK040_003615 [Willaertia magna]
MIKQEPTTDDSTSTTSNGNNNNTKQQQTINYCIPTDKRPTLDLYPEIKDPIELKKRIQNVLQAHSYGHKADDRQDIRNIIISLFYDQSTKMLKEMDELRSENSKLRNELEEKCEENCKLKMKLKMTRHQVDDICKQLANMKIEEEDDNVSSDK